MPFYKVITSSGDSETLLGRFRNMVNTSSIFRKMPDADKITIIDEFRHTLDETSSLGTVRPGDLISADFANGVLETIVELQERLGELAKETGNSTGEIAVDVQFNNMTAPSDLGALKSDLAKRFVVKATDDSGSTFTANLTGIVAKRKQIKNKELLDGYLRFIIETLPPKAYRVIISGPTEEGLALRTQRFVEIVKPGVVEISFNIQEKD
jgi:hypothetical protein